MSAVRPLDLRGDLSGSEVLLSTAAAVSAGSSLETLSRPFLEILYGLTGLESVYLTEVRLEDDEQTVLYAENRGELTIAEGNTVTWRDTLCHRALELGVRSTSDVSRDLPGSESAAELGLRTYVSVPVTGDHGLIGTLCGASQESVTVSPEVIEIMAMLARLIADQWRRDREQGEDRRRALAAEQRLRERDLFLAVAEHKLKTPLMVLQGWSDVLAEDWSAVPPATREQALSDMREAAQDALDQLDRLLTQARSWMLSTNLAAIPVQLSPLIRKTVRQLQAASNRHHVIANISVEAVVQADPQALWQVLWHLGENAVKYSPEGGTIRIDVVSVGEDRVAVTISDEGVGLPTDIDLFAPFTRAADDQGIKGSGLGLHIVRTLLTAMDGTVAAPQQPAQGSALTFVLPLSA